MRSLVVAPFSPWPRIFGGALRLWSVLEILGLRGRPDLLAYRSWTPPGEDPIPELRKICREVVLLDQPTSEPSRRRWTQIRSVFDYRSFQYHFFHSDHFQRELNRILDAHRPELVVVEQSQMAFFDFRRAKSAIRVLDLQNIEHELLERRAEVEEKRIRRLALRWEAMKFGREERALLSRFDVVLAPSERECARLSAELGRNVRVSYLPNTLDLTRYADRLPLAREPRLVFVGSTHVDANRDAVLWFVKSILPRIVAVVPNVKLAIVGGGPPPEVRALTGPNVEVTGYVPDVVPWMQQARVLVVPLRSGGGTRLKILEGMACGTPVVSTPVGAEGLDVVDGRDLLLAADEAAFAQATLRLLQDDRLAEQLRRSGEEAVKARYSWRAAAPKLWHPVDEILNAGASSPSTNVALRSSM